MDFEQFLKNQKNLGRKSKQYTLEELFDLEDEISENALPYLPDEEPQVEKLGERGVFVGSTLESVLRSASRKLGLPLADLKYEILEKGKSGLLGLMGKKWKIRILDEVQSTPLLEGEEGGEVKDYLDKKDIVQYDKKDFYHFGVEIHIGIKGGAVLKKTGGKINTEKVLTYINSRYNNHYDDQKLIQFLVSDEKELLLGEYTQDIQADFVIDMMPLEEKLFIYIREPRMNGKDLEEGDLKRFLANEGVVPDSMDEEIISMVENKKIYNKKILIAQGVKPKHGRNATLKMHVKEMDGGPGNVKIINVKEGETLFEKIPIEDAINGMDVFGNEIVTKTPVDINMEAICGENIELSEDGLVARSKVTGQLIKGINGEYSVRDVIVIDGDVGPKSGNIDFVGSVEVRGSILDGYSVKVGGNLTVQDSVEGADVEVQGSLIVNLGINGKEKARIICGGDVYSKFIQDARLEAQNNVFLEEGAIRVSLYCNGNFEIKGKRANIIGGEVFAKNFVRVSSIGNEQEQKTVVRVGFPGVEKGRHVKMESKLREIEPNYMRISLSMSDMEKKGPDYIRKNKEKYEEMKIERDTLSVEFNTVKKEVDSLRRFLEENKNEKAFIEAEGEVFPNSYLYCCDAEIHIKHEVKSSRFTVNENNADFIFVSSITGSSKKK